MCCRACCTRRRAARSSGPAACAEALRRAQTPAVAGDGVELAAKVNEIVDSVLDAADHELLEEVGVAAAGVASKGIELLRALSVDVLRRYRERPCQDPAPR